MAGPCEVVLRHLESRWVNVSEVYMTPMVVERPAQGRLRQEIQCHRCGEQFRFDVLSDPETRAYRQRSRWVFAVFLAGWLGLLGLIGWMIVAPDSSGGLAVLLAVVAGLLLVRLTVVAWNMFSDGIVGLRVVWPNGATGRPGRKHSIAPA